MPSTPRIRPHSLGQVGDTVVLRSDDDRLKNIPLCAGRLKRRIRASDDRKMNVLYVVGHQTQKR
jgi:hypothetical protein